MPVKLENIDPIIKELNNLGNQIQRPVSTPVQHVPVPRQMRKLRPVNWKDIAWDYISYRNIHRTVRTFNLLERNSKLDYWYTILPRWRKQYNAGYEASSFIRAPVYGHVIDKA